MEHGTSFNVVLLGHLVIIHLLPSKNQPVVQVGSIAMRTDQGNASHVQRMMIASSLPLLNRGNAFPFLDSFLNPGNGVVRLDIDLNLLPCQRLNLLASREQL